MLKVVGALSPNDPNKEPLWFDNEEAASNHVAMMNLLIPLYDDPSSKLWNKEYWKERPQPWEVVYG